MIRILLFSIIMLSCSSLSKQKYQVNTIEASGDKMMQFADNMRINRHYEKALKYYDRAAELYLLKNDRKKYLTTQSRIAIIKIKMKDINGFEKKLTLIKQFISIEHVDFNRQVEYLNAKKFEYDQNDTEAIKIYNTISQNVEHIERKAFYKFQSFKLMKSYTNKNMERAKDLIEDLDERYEDGELEFIELYSACKYIMAKMSINVNNNKALGDIRDVERLYTALEYSSKLVDAYKLYIDHYSKLDDNEKVTYYNNKIENHKVIFKTYLN